MLLRFSPIAPVMLVFVFLAVLGAAGIKIPLPFFDQGYSLRIDLPEAGQVALPEVAGAADRALPLVVIDPGHGGRDPGATGQGLQEKTLVLALAKVLRDELVEQGIARVALTRDDDRYLVHEERFGIARRLDADLFLSIHADSAGEATEIAGASIYTLSNEASSQAAARFAARENSTRQINGLRVENQEDSVSSILVELAQRRTQEQSREFARLIEREGAPNVRFHPQAQRSAALRVLRAPDVPSVLYESGFITNAAEARNLTTSEGQQRFARALARAIQIYFVRNPRERVESSGS